MVGMQKKCSDIFSDYVSMHPIWLQDPILKMSYANPDEMAKLVVFEMSTLLSSFSRSASNPQFVRNYNILRTQTLPAKFKEKKTNETSQ